MNMITLGQMRKPNIIEIICHKIYQKEDESIMKSPSNTIKYPYIAPLLGGGSFVTFSICTYIAIMEQAFQSIIGFGIFALAGLILLLTINWQIQYDETGFTYRNLFRMSRHYSYSDVDSVRNLMGDTILLIGH